MQLKKEKKESLIRRILIETDSSYEGSVGNEHPRHTIFLIQAGNILRLPRLSYL